MARRKRHEAHENHERWLVSYADFITLLFAFFVVLYAISQVDLKKLSQAAKSFGASFGGETERAPESDSSRRVDPDAWRYAPIFPNVIREDEAKRAEEELRALREIKERLLAILAADGLDGRAEVGLDGRGLVVRIAPGALFRGAGTALQGDGTRLLDRLGAIARTLGSPVVLRARAAPASGADVASLFEKNAARAAAVCRYLGEEQRVDPRLLFLSAEGETAPASLRGNSRPENAFEIVIVRPGAARDVFR
jgi:chemotaxis protein MotB